MKVENFLEAKRYLSAHIPKNPKNIFQGSLGLKRIKSLLLLIDNPQDKLKVIHIAGTSGKSSTSYLLSLLLSCVGKKTGLFISPHIINIRERISINNKFISEIQFVKALNEIIPFIERVEKTELGTPTYFEILTVLAFYFFRKEKVDYAVIETGIGGLQDGTNVVNNTNKVCIITKLGMDHTEILGKTLTEITKQKAGIITKNAIVITPKQESTASSIIKNSAKNNGAKLFILNPEINYKDIKENRGKTVFTFDFLKTHLSHVSLGLLGKYQAENCSLALATFTLLCTRDGFIIDEKKIRNILEQANFFGRMSRYRIAGKNVIIDGAHNEQKMESLIQTVSQLYPGEKFNFLLAFKSTKDFIPLLRLISPLAASITITSFKMKAQDWSCTSKKPEIIAEALSQIGFSNYRVVVNPQEALEQLLNKRDKTDIIITGSFYLISELYLSLRGARNERPRQTRLRRGNLVDNGIASPLRGLAMTNGFNKTMLMGILNLTPDSFSDGGEYFQNTEKAVARAKQMIEEGADIIDIGGESSRPGSEGVSAQEELNRVLPVIKLIRKKLGNKTLLSIDTNKAIVAKEVLKVGVDIINSLGGFLFDKELAGVAAHFGCPVILYHIKGEPKTMQKGEIIYEDVIEEIVEFFGKQIEHGLQKGMKREQFFLDPGIGFGKTVEQNIEIIKRLGEFNKLKLPIIIGVSRKSHLGKLLEQEFKLKQTPGTSERLEAGLAETAVAVLKGAQIVRTHDVAETKRFLSVLDLFNSRI